MDDSPRPEPAAMRLLLHVYRLVAIALGLWLLLPALPAIAPKLTLPVADGGVGWYAAQKFVAGVNPCNPAVLDAAHLTGLGQPPTVALWFLPFASLPVEQMGTDVRLLTIFLLLFHLFALAREHELRTPLAVTALLFGWVFSRQFFMAHLDVGQISEWIACLIVATWVFWRRDDGLGAGVCLGLACTLKLFPAGIGLLFLLERRWRAVVAALGTYAAAIAVVTARWGWRLWPDFFRSDHELLRYWVPSLHSGSLYSIVTRALQRDLLQRLPPAPRATLVFLVLALALVAAFVWLQRRATTAATRELAFAFVATLAPFLHPVQWEHYAVLWLLPLAIVARQTSLVAGWRRALIVAAVALTVVCMSLPMHMRSTYMKQARFDPSARGWLHLYDAANWLPSLLLMAAAAALIVWRRRASRTA